MVSPLLVATFCLPLVWNTSAAEDADGPLRYVCPPCGPCDVLIATQPGTCPDENCGMELVDERTVPRLLVLVYREANPLSVAAPGQMLDGARAGFVSTVAKTLEPPRTRTLARLLAEVCRKLEDTAASEDWRTRSQTRTQAR